MAKKYTKEEIKKLKEKHKDINVPDEDITRDSSFNKDVEKVVGYKEKRKE